MEEAVTLGLGLRQRQRAVPALLLLLALASLLPRDADAAFTPQTGSGSTTRYWDCCKPTCSWSENAGSVTAPVKACARDGSTSVALGTQSTCAGGSAFMCTNQQPFADSSNASLAYGFAAANVNGLSVQSLCCACFRLSFTSSTLQNTGKQMIVQVTNTGSDLGSNQFDIQIPGGGVGAFPAGCVNQWGSTSGWGAQYGGVSSSAQCSNLPSALQAGCLFRYNWFANADNPNVNFERVACPTALTSISQCTRTEEQ